MVSRIRRYPCPDPQNGHDALATRLGLEVDLDDVREDVAARRPGFVLVDCRDAGRHAEAHLPGAVSLPWGRADRDAAERLLGPPGDDVLVCYGAGQDLAAERTAVHLAPLGYPVKVLLGGFAAWVDAGLPLEGRVGTAEVGRATR